MCGPHLHVPDCSIYFVTLLCAPLLQRHYRHYHLLLLLLLLLSPVSLFLSLFCRAATMRKKSHFEFKLLAVFLFGFSSFFLCVQPQANPGQDVPEMLALKKSLNPPESLGWSGPDPCQWKHVSCTDGGRIRTIQIGRQNLQGTLSPSLQNLTELVHLDLQYNSISGPLPSLKGLSSLQVLMLSNNKFSSIHSDFFMGMSSLQSVEIDSNPFSEWEIPESLQSASGIQNFSANSANITGKIPNFFNAEVFPSLTHLHLAFNYLEGVLPASFSGLQIVTLWLDGQQSDGELTGPIDVIQNMTYLQEVWLHANAFSGPLPDFSGLKDLQILSLRDNLFTGPVPVSLINLQSLRVVNLTNNLLQGPMPEFKDGVEVDMSKDTNRFCLAGPGDCDPRLYLLLSIVKDMGYPLRLADSWKGNDPCVDWLGITCSNGNITVVNFQNMGLGGTISPEFASLKSLQRLVLAENNLTGQIPEELTTLPVLTGLDVANNHLYGKVPNFRSNVIINTKGNLDIGKDRSSISPRPAGSPNSTSPTTRGDSSGSSAGKKKSAPVGVIIFSVIGGVLLVSVIGFIIFCLFRMKHKRLSRVQSPNTLVVHPRHSGSDNDSVKITVAGSSVSVGAVNEAQTVRGSEAGDIQMVEAGSMVISIQVLRNVTNNFSEKNILGQGGFGTVYKGELHDGTQIAVKRMESGAITGKGVTEFQSEIAVLTKVRHRHLVALLGYCLDGNEKLLVYEYMPQGTLSRHLFNWPEEGLKPLEWNRRLTIALDVARGVEYLHCLAHQCFIHRDLKPSNILLGDDMRAKVADFGLVRLVPDGKASIVTRLAGTFGYLAPEYAFFTGRVTTKVDVFSFGVILMELITGRKAIDETQTEDSMHLATWFCRMYLQRDSIRDAIDPTINLDEETLASIHTVAELAGHCCAREPYQRPDMGHAVNVLSSLVQHWKPSDQNSEGEYDIDLEMPLQNSEHENCQACEGISHMESSSSSFL